MGCDIHSFAERKVSGKWEKVEEDFIELSEFDKEWYKKEKGNMPFNCRNYSMFAFLAGVRNYDCCEPLSEPRGLPNDSEYLNHASEDWMGYTQTEKRSIETDGNYHSMSYLTLKELLDFDYEKTFWNRRISRTAYNKNGGSSTNGACLAEEGEGEFVSYKENLGSYFFKELEELKALGKPEEVRIVFYFDN